MDVQSLMASLWQRALVVQAGPPSTSTASSSSAVSDTHLRTLLPAPLPLHLHSAQLLPAHSANDLRSAVSSTFVNAHFGVPHGEVAEASTIHSLLLDHHRRRSVESLLLASNEATNQRHLSTMLARQRQHSAASTSAPTVIVARPPPAFSSNVPDSVPRIAAASSPKFIAASNSTSTSNGPTASSAFRQPTTSSGDTTIVAESENATKGRHFDDLLEAMFNRALRTSTEGGSSEHDAADFQSTSTESTFSSDRSKAIGVLRCQVCSDQASGFHYGIHSCEGCKGFFRRSIQNKISYAPCKKNRQCVIARSTRNRCQNCRLQKCVAVGMSRDAVRFGRVPKREKVRLEEEILRSSVQSQLDLLSAELEDDVGIIDSLNKGFHQLRMAIVELEANSKLTTYHANLPAGTDAVILNVPAYFQAVPHLVAFSKALRGFHRLDRECQADLLKGSAFQLLLLAWSSSPCQMMSVSDMSVESSSMCWQRPSLDATLIPARLLVSNYGAYSSLYASVVEFTQRFRLLDLSGRQLAVFAAMMLCQSDGVSNNITSITQDSNTPQQQHEARIQRTIRERLWLCLQSMLPQHSLSCTVINQALLAACAELKSMGKSHQELVSRIPLPSAFTELSLATIHDVTTTATESNNGVDAAAGPVAKDNKRPTKKRIRKGVARTAAVEQASKGAPSNGLALGELPELRRMLERPPHFCFNTQQPPAVMGEVEAKELEPNANDNPTNLDGVHQTKVEVVEVEAEELGIVGVKADIKVEIREAHREVVSLLESAANAPNPLQQSSPSLDTTEQSVSVENGDDAEEEPLNLCIREMRP